MSLKNRKYRNMSIRKIVLSLSLLSLLAFPAELLSQTSGKVEPLFEYPRVPDKLTKVNMRSNYMVEHLWDKCRLDKEPISNLESFHETFTDYLSFFVLADRNVIEKSIESYVEKVSKNSDNLNLTIGVLNAEVLNIRSQYCSDDVYRIFAKYLLENKRVPDDLKNRVKANVEVLTNSAIGTVIGDIPLVKSPLEATTLYGLTPEFTLLFFNAEGNIDSSIYKVRLSANLAVNNLISAGVLSIVSVLPDGEGLEEKAAAEPSNWCVGRLADFQNVYDMRIVPTVYLLDKEKKIIEKFLQVDQALQIFEGLEYSKNNKQ